MESKNEKFRRLAKRRAEIAADALRKLGNLSSPNYEYSGQEVDQLFRYIDTRVKAAKQEFMRHGKRGASEFRWPDAGNENDA